MDGTDIAELFFSFIAAIIGIIMMVRTKPSKAKMEEYQSLLQKLSMLSPKDPRYALIRAKALNIGREAYRLDRNKGNYRRTAALEARINNDIMAHSQSL
ncbi:hypothetical protein [Alicyclobacillus fodiniaquatilis]|uniref:Uncharacterized protein n=1 Tax=Alicyclobacillus fodiniaquatilis TaxID=1661150 RepID=A0ABW4JKD5_9BACL